MNSTADASHKQREDAGQLSALLTMQLESARRLNENIEAISQNVVKSDFAELTQLLSAKTDILEQLDRQNGDLQLWLRAHGLPENAVSDAIASLPDNGALLDTWNQFKQIVSDCQMKNTANGSIVHGQLKQTRQVLNLLTGQAADAQGPYTARGQCGDDSNSRSLAKA